ncbi:hypothetical protein [Sphingomonas sp. Mn802worker]|uniref:hypothetical protein n=1 Tax=Sphingomonas sp. Mn802worker TaxID=629773 RepID=UPI000374D6FC|nr:hypothetical protein [Sphingomonas sp. Mn802worker]
MTIRRYAFGAAVLLAACNQPAPSTVNATDPAVSNSDASATNTADTIASLSEGQRKAVLFRAIRDGDEACQEITAATATQSLDNKPAWLVTCDKQQRYTVVLRNGDTALVTPVTTQN